MPCGGPITQANGRVLTLDQIRAERRRVRAAVELERLKREQRLLESWSDFSRPVFDPARLASGSGLWSPIANRGDRRRGENWPLFRTEQELSIYRGAARYLADTNEYAIGLLEGLTGYVIGPGFTYRASSKDDANAELVALVQDVIDDFTDPYAGVAQVGDDDGDEIASSWPELEAELFRRSRVDGEFFLRYGTDDRGKSWVRTVEPEQVTQPPDEEGRTWSFGIKTPAEDVQCHQAYWVAYLDERSLPTDGEELTPAELVHCRVNVPLSVKRGLTDFHHGTLKALDTSGRLLECIGEGAAVQAATAEIWQHESSTKADVQRLVTEQGDYTRERDYPDRTRTSRYQTVEPGAVRHIPKGMQSAALPSSQAPQHVEALHACLQGAGRRWLAPSWLATGASEDMAAYTAALVAESPFVRRIQLAQRFYARHFLRVIWAVVRNAVKTERLPPEALQLVTIQAEPPTVETRNKLEEAQANQIRVQMGWKSRQTVCQEEGGDWEQEAVNIHEYEEEHGAQGPPLDQAPDEPPAPGGAPPGPFGEARRLRECGGEGGQPGPCPQGGGDDAGGGDHPATTRARAILAKAGGKLSTAARATVDKVKEKVKAKYAKMEARYGRKGAIAVMAACVALTPVPVPGTSFAPIAVAELALAAGKLFKGGEAVEGEPDVAELARALAELMAEAYRTAGEEPPVYDDGELEGAIRGALAV